MNVGPIHLDESSDVATPMIRYWEADCRMLAAFVSKGYLQRQFFPHRLVFVPKCGSDAYKLARRMFGVLAPGDVWQAVLYATEDTTHEFPPQLFGDTDINWHQQHLGLPGQVAAANFAVAGTSLFVTTVFSDLVQRIGRRRDFKTRIESHFNGWDHLLYNGILQFASSRGVRDIFFPTAALAIANTSPSRRVHPELFERIYDRVVQRRFLAKSCGPLWVINVADNQSRLAPLSRRSETLKASKTICVAHDIERGLGHVGIDADLESTSTEVYDQHLAEMLAIEKANGVHATFNVVAAMLEDVREPIEAGGHCLGMHSFDHSTARRQLERCRFVDNRIKGYRPPRSRHTSELTDENLCFHNFEWFASGEKQLACPSPIVENSLVKIPIVRDDFPMYKTGQSFRDWQADLIAIIERRDFVAFGLHDCYARHWLPHYGELLGKIKSLGQLATFDEVANHAYLSNSF